MDKRIRRYIRAKQRLIQLLEEQRQAIIHRAVTRGLDPNVRLKPSGVEWLGEVPEHWGVMPLGAVADVIDPNPSHRNPTYVEHGFPFISTVEFIGTDDIELDTPRRVTEEIVAEQERRCRFGPGSIAFSRKGTIGSARILPKGVRFALLDSVCVINCGASADYRYMYYQVGSSVLSAQLGVLVRGAALPQVSVGRVRRTRVLVPPVIEQQQIAKEIRALVAPINELVTTAERELELLDEYRPRLFSDVLTGKLDVREAVSRLPYQAEDSEPLSDVDVEGETAEAFARDVDELPEMAEA